MRRPLLAAAIWAVASAPRGNGKGKATRVLAADTDTDVPVTGKTLWMFWRQGIANLKAKPAGTWYGHGHRCIEYWRRLNPGYSVRVLDDQQASMLSPSYRAMKKRGLKVQLMADVLRLELLSLYGGVWADVMSCPIVPLDDYVAKVTQSAGFFTWKGDYGTAQNWPGLCTKRKVHELDIYPFPGTTINDNWFLVSPRPHNHIVDMWLSAVKEEVAKLPDRASPDGPEYDYEYHFPQCIVNDLYDNSTAFRKAYDTIPTLGYCQHNGNAIEYCTATRIGGDTRPDPRKWMYKGLQSLAHMDLYAYEAQIRRREPIIWGSTGVRATAFSNPPVDGSKRYFLCPDAVNASDPCNRRLAAMDEIMPTERAPVLVSRQLLRGTMSLAAYRRIRPTELIESVQQHPELQNEIRPILQHVKMPVQDKLFAIKRIVAKHKTTGAATQANKMFVER